MTADGTCVRLRQALGGSSSCPRAAEGIGGRAIGRLSSRLPATENNWPAWRITIGQSEVVFVPVAQPFLDGRLGGEKLSHSHRYPRREGLGVASSERWCDRGPRVQYPRVQGSKGPETIQAGHLGVWPMDDE